MKRTDITSISPNTNIIVCDPFVFSRDPSHAENAEFVGCWFGKDGTPSPVGTHAKVSVGGNERLVTPNMIIGKTEDVQGRMADIQGKVTAARAADEAKLQAARDRIDALLAVLAPTKIAFAVSRDFLSVTVTADALSQLTQVLFPETKVAVADDTNPVPTQDDDNQDFVTDVRAHAVANYEKDSWDFVVECWTDQDIREQTQGCKTAKSAIKKVGKAVKTINEQREEVQNA